MRRERIEVLALVEEPWLVHAMMRCQIVEGGEWDYTSSGRIVVPYGADEVEASVMVRHILWHLVRNHPARAERAGVNGGLAACLELCSPDPAHLGLPSDLLLEEYAELLDKHTVEVEVELAHGTTNDNYGSDGDWEAVGNLVAVGFDRATSNRGNAPAGTERWVSDKLTPPRLPWQLILQGGVSSAVRSKGDDDYTWQAPNWRKSVLDNLAQTISPSTVSYASTVGVVVDTSGSMTESQLLDAISEVVGIIETTGAVVMIVSCDVDSSEPMMLERGTDIRNLRLFGGGGSDMSDGLAALAGTEVFGDRLSAGVVITDGHVAWPPLRPGTWPVFAVLVGGLVAVPEWVQPIDLRAV